jgi:hypothetical protein
MGAIFRRTQSQEKEVVVAKYKTKSPESLPDTKLVVFPRVTEKLERPSVTTVYEAFQQTVKH